MPARGMPVVALLPQRRLSQGTQSIPGLRLKKLGAALPPALPGRLAWLLAGLVTVCRGKRSLSPNLVGLPGHFKTMLWLAAAVLEPEFQYSGL